ncbi:crotonase/enoyl-CoA hydratase family protein [Allosphingosinicella deserti]|uniref:Crotonase/enoyl-CoA hydratase family protein n=1 Tax=Allosphingosinicella deserti TaxID=2116704 RepID=A0A2P7QGC5_9SPHN|nr:crotonase/enoyl-CoA hydratase family protein [Sphingomonas deserti]PSJ37022.1 crotonase/enoyl-CoA hydratase family protein [Sphingomonas deserti]
MESERIAIERDGGVAHVMLARGDRMNAMDGAMFAAIGETFERLGSDPTVRAIVLSGEGRHFTSGIDLHYAMGQFAYGGDHGRGTESRLRHIQRLQDAFTALETARPPVIAAIQGGCIGAGVDLASACDIRLASSDAYFQIAEVDVAITADLGTLQRLTHLISQGMVRELAYTGRRMDAQEAERLGLVNRILESRESLLAAALDMARTIAAKSPLAVAGAKMSLNYSRGRTVEEGLRHVAMWNAGALVSADLGVALEARLSKGVARFEDLDL